MNCIHTINTFLGSAVCIYCRLTTKLTKLLYLDYCDYFSLLLLLFCLNETGILDSAPLFAKNLQLQYQVSQRAYNHLITVCVNSLNGKVHIRWLHWNMITSNLGDLLIWGHCCPIVIYSDTVSSEIKQCFSRDHGATGLRNTGMHQYTYKQDTP